MLGHFGYKTGGQIGQYFEVPHPSHPSTLCVSIEGHGLQMHSYEFVATDGSSRVAISALQDVEGCK